jgi:transposase-like protein
MTNKRLQASPKKRVPCPKKKYQKTSFELKLAVIDKIQSGQISLNHASKVYQISRSSINYWIKKLSIFSQTKKGVSKTDEIRKLKQRIEELEFIKDFQQDCIIDFEKITGEELSKKLLPEALAKEIAKKKKRLTK